jgi:thiamine-monophosphate kinase
MQVKDAGEHGVIALIRRMQTPLPPGFVGIGDDAAVIPGHAGGWLVSQDMLVEGVHFRTDWATPEQIGTKAAAVNLSDIAAMGGEPAAVLTSLAVPGAVEVAWVQALYRGLTRALEPAGVSIIGGDTVGMPDRIVLDVTILGRPHPNGPVYRRGAAPGDRLVLSGRVGASYAGLYLLQRGISWPGRNANEHSVLVAHLTPQAQVTLGYQVAPWVHAMTDLSDGLGQEVQAMVQDSGLGADIDLEQLPIDQATAAVAAQYGGPVAEWAVRGGEDYELLMAVPPAHWDRVQAIGRSLGVRLTEIGVVTQTPGVRWYRGANEVTFDGERPFFDHFAG